VKKLPPILAIQLKRFEYDFERVCAIKFNDYFEFPRDLDMDPYTGMRECLEAFVFKMLEIKWIGLVVILYTSTWEVSTLNFGLVTGYYDSFFMVCISLSVIDRIIL
jgi:hypothetical protein